MNLFGRHALSPWETPSFALSQAFTRPGPVGTYFDVPNGAFPVPWGPEEECPADRPELYGGPRLGQVMVRPGPVGTYFDVPNGAFPVPWGPEEECPADGSGLYGGRFTRLGQAAAPNCERTPEGGVRCSDGTYHPPGCLQTPGAPGTVQGAPPSEFPVLPVAAGAVVAAAGAALLLAGRRIGIIATLENNYPAEYEVLQRLSASITAERAADAYNFAQVQASVARRQDLVFQERDAQVKLAEEERRWEVAHRNAAELEAAQAEVDRLAAEVAMAAAEAADYRARVEANARTIMALRAEADTVIDSLIEPYRTEGRRMIDPCVPGGIAMRGSAFLPQLQGRGIPTRPIGLFHRGTP